MIDPRLKLIFKHYGFPHQLSKLKEELLECVEAIDAFEKQQGGWSHVEEERADVQNMIDQFRSGVHCQYRIDQIREQKLDRQIARIAAEISAKEAAK